MQQIEIILERDTGAQLCACVAYMKIELEDNTMLMQMMMIVMTMMMKIVMMMMMMMMMMGVYCVCSTRGNKPER